MDTIHALMQHAKNGRGLWIGLFPRIDAPIQAMGFGDHAPYVNGDPHVTLAHLGRSVDEATMRLVHGAAANAARSVHTVDASVTGYARFAGGGKEGNPVVLLLRGPDIYRTQHAVCDALDAARVHFDRSFDFIPHITMGRAPEKVLGNVTVGVTLPPVERVRIMFDRIGLVCGDCRAFFPLALPPF